MLFREYMRHGSVKRLARHLSLSGYATRSGGEWTAASLCWLLRNPVYRGLISYGEVQVPGKHLPIIAPIVWNKVTKMLDTRAGKRRMPMKCPTCRAWREARRQGACAQMVELLEQ